MGSIQKCMQRAPPFSFSMGLLFAMTCLGRHSWNATLRATIGHVKAGRIHEETGFLAAVVHFCIHHIYYAFIIISFK